MWLTDNFWWLHRQMTLYQGFNIVFGLERGLYPHAIFWFEHRWRTSIAGEGNISFFIIQEREKGQHTAPFLWVQVEKWKIWGCRTNPPALHPQAVASAWEGVSFHSWPCGTNKEQHCVGAPPPPTTTTYLDVWLLIAKQDNINLRLNKLGNAASFEDASLSSSCSFLELKFWSKFLRNWLAATEMPHFM